MWIALLWSLHMLLGMRKRSYCCKNGPGKFGLAGPARNAARAAGRARATARSNVPGPDHFPHRKIGPAGPNLPKSPTGQKFP